jgi:hypothetical protein
LHRETGIAHGLTVVGSSTRKKAIAALEPDPKIGRAEALRRTMLSLIKLPPERITKRIPLFEHRSSLLERAERTARGRVGCCRHDRNKRVR